MATYNQLEDIRGSILDAQDTEMFDFVIQQVPGSGINSRDLAIACQQAVYPGRQNAIREVAVHGSQIHFRGRARMTYQMQVVYVESYNLPITAAIRSWMEFQTGTLSGTSAGYKEEYALNGPVLIKYDTTGEIADELTFYGLMPEEIQEVQLSGDSDETFLVTVTFRYDFYTSKIFELR